MVMAFSLRFNLSLERRSDQMPYLRSMSALSHRTASAGGHLDGTSRHEGGDRAGRTDEGGDGRGARLLRPGQRELQRRQIADTPVRDPGTGVQASDRLGDEPHDVPQLDQVEDL